MNYVDKMKMRLLEDSNFIFGLKGKKVKKLSDFNGDIKVDYIYGIFDYGDLISDHQAPEIRLGMTIFSLIMTIQ